MTVRRSPSPVSQWRHTGLCQSCSMCVSQPSPARRAGGAGRATGTADRGAGADAAPAPDPATIGSEPWDCALIDLPAADVVWRSFGVAHLRCRYVVVANQVAADRVGDELVCVR